MKMKLSVIWIIDMYVLHLVWKYYCMSYTRAGENVVCVECLKVLDSSNEKLCGMCEMPICSDQCQVRFKKHAKVIWTTSHKYYDVITY